MVRVMTYNVMEGGVVPDPGRLSCIGDAVTGAGPDVVGLQEVLPNDMRLRDCLEACGFPFFEALEAKGSWTHGSTVAFASKFPLVVTQVGSRVRALVAEVVVDGELINLVNVYLSHVGERVRVREIGEVLAAYPADSKTLLLGDMNALSPASLLTEKDLHNFSERMREKYTLDGHLSFATVDRILGERYYDAALRFYSVGQITRQTLLSGGSGNHTRPIRMDYFFATEQVLPFVCNLRLVSEGPALWASDHFPWVADLTKPVGTSRSLGISAVPSQPTERPRLAA